MSSQVQFTADQLAAARAAAWHQDGNAILTMEAARAWVEGFGLVLFGPRAQQLGAPAPSLVEATHGKAMEAATAAESATARGFAARMAAEGSALPLNLLGSAGDTPDFIVSAKVFSFVFTVRGDKGWKLPPATSGANKVSPLALRVYEVLLERGAMAAAELATELGREVTEPAILRALNELWAQLRVIPQMQQSDSAPTLWELTATRFAKTIKAGANAGQPTALSALLSLYLGQAIASTEEEAAGFLSPLTSRSRVRDVVHALVSQRQLDETVVEGRTLVSVSGALPEFPEAAVPEPVEGEAAEGEAGTEGEGRIKRFTARPERRDGEFRGKPAAGARTRPAARSGGFAAKPDRERRPFNRASDAGAEKPSFSKPWDEDRKPRREDAGEGGGEAPRPRRTFGAKPAFGDRKGPGAPRKTFGARPAGPGGPRKSFGDRAREGGGDRPSFARRDSGDAKPFARKPFGKPRSFGDAEGGERKPYVRRDASEGGAERRPYTPRAGAGDRKPYERKPFVRREGAEGAERKPFAPRGNFGDRKPFAPRGGAGGERKPYVRRDAAEGGERKPYVRRDTAEGGERRPYTPRAGAGGPRSFAPREGKRPYTPREGGGDDRPSFPRKPAGGSSFGGGKSFGGAKSFGGGKSFGAKPAGGSDRGEGTGRPAPRFGGGASRGPGGGGARFGGGRPGGKPAGGSFKKRAPGAPPKRKPESEE